jgi:GAF domain-containing protein
MSKKKINKRLDKLFDEINKEAEAPAEGTKRSGELPTTPLSPSVKVSPDAPEQFSNGDLSMLEDRHPMPKQVSLSPSTMLSTAFRTDENSWATLKVVDDSEQRKWGSEEQMLVRQVADQLSLALENARLFQETQRRASEMTALAEVGRDISATLELQAVLEHIVRRAHEILNAVTTAVYVPDPEFKTLMAIAAIGEEVDEIKKDPLEIGEGILGNIALTKVGEIINDVTNDSRAVTIEGTEDVSDEHLMAATILTQDRLNGLVVVWRIGAGQEFSQQEFEFLESLAQQAAIAVENVRLFEETQERAEELAVLNEMARELSAEMNVARLSETVYKFVERLIDTTNFFITLYDDKTSTLTFPLSINNNQRIEKPSRPLGKGLTDFIIQSKAPLFMPDNIPAHIEKIGVEFTPLGNDKPAQCWLGVPLMIGDRVTGAIVVQSVEKPRIFDEDDKELLMTVAGQVSIALENARLFNEAQSRARREKILREITAHIRATNDPEMIAKTAVRELGQALGASAFIHLGSEGTTKTVNSGAAKSNSKKKKKDASGKAKSPAKKRKKPARGDK